MDYNGRFDTSTDSRYLPIPDWFGDTSDIQRRYRSPSKSIKEISWSPLTGVVITENVTENERRRQGLLAALQQLRILGEVSLRSLNSALAFIQCLPLSKALPKVAPDGEGGVIMAWDVVGRGRTLITVSDGVVYGVVDAATPQARYIQDSPASFDLIEDRILEIIPT